MAYSALLEYIRKAKGCDASDEEIVERLVKSGWYRIDATDALMLYGKLSAPTERLGICEPLRPPPDPSLVERLAPRHYEPHLVAFAALAFAFGFVGYLVLSR